MAPQKLRDLIRLIRAAKTAADEREVVQKEAAAIRDHFRTEDPEYRARNVSKVLYMYMLGYPAHFAQLECLKLVASAKYPDKRVGYLGAMLLLDELKDVNLLITNSLKTDVHNPNQYIAGLALSALGTICSAEMARDISDEIEKLIKSTNPFLRKKALLCALRIVRRVPDLIETFIPATRALLSERNHAVLITGVTLLTEMASQNEETLGHFRRLVPSLVVMLKNLVTGYSQEHDVSGLTDPFLQCALLRLMRVLGKGDRESSDAMSDILAQVATNTDSSKNVGNAVLYESVLCIMNIESESGLRVLAINILGRFLLNHDRNIRYVALNTLLRTVQTTDSSDAVQRHRSTIVDCLKELDISIRRRACELAFALINQENVESLVGELLEVLQSAEPEFKSFMTTELLIAGEKFSQNTRWHVDTSLKILEMAGSYVRADAVAGIVSLIAGASDLHPYIVKRLYQYLSDDITQPALTQVGAWSIGEFGDLLVNAHVDEIPVQATEHEVLDLLQTVLTSTSSNSLTRNYAFTAIMKLSSRFSSASFDRIRTMISNYGTTHELELQQRSNEYTTIFNAFENLRPSLLERMPVADRAAIAAASAGAHAKSSTASAAPASIVAPSSNTGDLLDLMGDSSSTKPSASSGATDMLDLLGLGLGAPSAPQAKPASNNLMDLLGGSFTSTPAQSKPASSSFGLDDLLGGLGSTQAKPAQSSAGGLFDLMGVSAAPTGIPSITAFQRDGLTITFAFKKALGSSSLDVLLTATNSTVNAFNGFTFQAAVPKSFQIILQTASSSIVPPLNSGSLTQQFTIINNEHQPIRLRVRIAFTVNGSPVQYQEEVSHFPSAAI